MRHRAFAFKGKKDEAKKQLKSVLKNRKMAPAVSGDAMHFRAPGLSPVHGYFKTTEDGKVTHVELFITTWWWYFLLLLMVTVACFGLGYIILDQDRIVAVFVIILGMFEFGIGWGCSKILEKKWELYLSHQMLLKKFF